MAKSSLILGPGQVLEYTVDVQEVRTLGDVWTEADKDWCYADKYHHVHFWEDGYPTLEWFSDEDYWCESCRDMHCDTWQRCPRCHEKIVPGTTKHYGPKYIQGMHQYYLNGERITDEQANELIDAARNKIGDKVNRKK